MRKLSLILAMVFLTVISSIAATQTFYFKNDAKWNGANLHVWGTVPNEMLGGFPGAAFISNGQPVGTIYKSGTNNAYGTCELFTYNGEDLFKVTIEVGDKKITNLIISENGNPGNRAGTGDLVFNDNGIYTKANGYTGTDVVSSNPDPDPSEKTPLVDLSNVAYYIFFEKPATWTTPCVHGWNDDEAFCTAAGKWPGDEMQKYYSDGSLYYWIPPTDKMPKTIIFSNNGGSQFDDQSYVNKATYKADGTHVGGEEIKPGPSDKTPLVDLSNVDYYVLYTNSNSWGSPTVHAWNKTYDVNCTTEGKWPGDAMSKYYEDGSVYYWILPSGKHLPTHIIFHNNSGTQTSDLDYYNKATYSADETHTGGEEAEDPIKPGPDPVPADAVVSGTLPVLHINVYDDAEHTAFNGDMLNKDYLLKDEHKYADYYIEVPEGVDYDWAKAVGSEEEPLPLTIKLRGNYTRSGFAKKPYKLKLGAKQGLLGLSKSKHFALLAHADDNFGYLRNFVGFNLGKLIGLPWTPTQQPVEVVLNGQYRGLYFLTESIRIESGRVDIAELADEESDATLCSGGYLVELDNYSESPEIQFQIKENGNSWGQNLMVTFDTPEILSSVQRQFIADQFTTMNTNIYSDELWKYMDLDDAVRYYLVMEIISHYEAYHGSTYMFRDRGENQKWHFSPMWDCGHAFDGPTNGYFYDNARYGVTWIKQMRSNGKFNAKLAETWKWFLSTHYDKVLPMVDEYAAIIDEAARHDAARWNNAPMVSVTYDPVNNNNVNPSQVVQNTDVLGKAEIVKDHLKNKIEWLEEQWGTIPSSYDEPARDTTPAAELPDYVKPQTDPEPIVEPKPEEGKTYVYVAMGENKDWSSNGTNAIYAYIYGDGGDNHSWPGVEMSYNSTLKYGNYTGLYFAEITSDFMKGKVILSSNGVQYPASMQPGMDINGKNVFFVTGGESLTALDAPILAEEEVVEESDIEKYWTKTLPLFCVTTDNGEAIPADKSKATGTWTMTMPDGSEVAPNKNNQMEIKGRGSDTWTNFSKKPYKIEFNKKQTLAGHTESKHFVLLPYLAGENENVMLENMLGYELSRRAGMNWTPEERPIELAINGKYQGLYFMTENIRPSVNRVAIGDYSDFGDDTVELIYDLDNDWLIEVDNFATAEETNFSGNVAGVDFKIVSSSPDFTAKKVTTNGHTEILPEILAGHMNGLIEAAAAAAADPESEEWAELIDANQAATFFMLQELMDDPRGFETAFFMHHTTGSKWNFGPVWDFSGAFASEKNGYSKDYVIHADEAAFASALYLNDSFKREVADKFFAFTGIDPENKGIALLSDEVAPMAGIGEYLQTQVAAIEPALAADSQIWPQYAAENLSDKATELTEGLGRNADFLASVWAENHSTAVKTFEANSAAKAEYFDITGRRLSAPVKGSVCIVRRGGKVSKEIR